MNRERIVVILCIGLIVGLGMISTIVPWRLTPAGRAYNGMHGFSDDYTGYVSYIKEGVSGRSWVAIRSLPLPQTPTTIHHFYLWIGYAARFFGVSAPLAYHLARLVLGAIFVFLVYRLFLSQFGWVDAVLGTLVAFGATSLSWLASPIGGFGRAWDISTVQTLSSFPFAVDVSGRATGRPHYLMADILVISIVLWFLRGKTHRTNVSVQGLAMSPPRRRGSSLKKYWIPAFAGMTNEATLPTPERLRTNIAILVLSFLLGIIHPAFGVIVLFMMAMALVRFPVFAVFSIGGLFSGLLISYWSTHQNPFVSMLAFESYVLYERIGLGQIWREVLAFGPVLWLAAAGFVWAIVVRKTTRGTGLMMYWLMATLLLFFFLFPVFRAERVRFVQSLYFVPMAYGAMLFFRLLAPRIGRWVTVMGAILLIAVSVPMYALALHQTTTNLTDYRVFPTWIFPTTKQMEAYRWMDKNTPKESTVLARFEAANNILLYSHNFVIGNRQGWTTEAGNGMETARDNFYLGVMSQVQAAAYLSKNNIRYVYSGYQEREMGDVSRYPFLSRVFDNGEVTIYVRNI